MSIKKTAVKRLRDTHAQATREALVAAACTLFVEKDFAATSLDQVAEAAGATKGAIYHHFSDKKAVFQAVYESLSRQLIARVTEDLQAMPPDPRRSVQAFVLRASEPQYQSILFRQGPSVLGAATCREIDMNYSLGIISQQIEALLPPALIAAAGQRTLARMLLSILVEAAQIIADAGDAAQAAAQVLIVLERVFVALQAGK